MKITYDDGGIYWGSVDSDGERSGHGKFIYPSGDVYVGDFYAGKKEGQGKFKWVNGETYEGGFYNGNFEGLGKYQWPGGNVYEGGFFKNNFHGFGYTYTKGKKCSETLGIYVNDNRFRNAVIDCEKYKKLKMEYCTFKNGDFFMGEIKRKKRNGYGVYIFESGFIYEGNFKDDFFFGLGVMYAPNRDVYVGENKNGKKDGKGKYTFANGEVLEGIWQNDKFIIHTKI